MEVKPFLSAREAAEYMDVCIGSIYRYGNNGDLPKYKPSGGRVYYKRDDINRFIEKHKVEIRKKSRK